MPIVLKCLALYVSYEPGCAQDEKLLVLRCVISLLLQKPEVDYEEVLKHLGHGKRLLTFQFLANRKP